MKKWLRKLFGVSELVKYNLPRHRKNVWYNYSIHADGEYPIVFDKFKNYIPCEIGLIAQMGVTKCGKKIYYKVTNMYRTRGGDWLYQSDAINCDMVFSHISE